MRQRLTGVLALVLPAKNPMLHPHTTDSRRERIILVLAKDIIALLDDRRRHRWSDGALQHERFQQLTIFGRALPALGSGVPAASAPVSDAMASRGVAFRFSHGESMNVVRTEEL